MQLSVLIEVRTILVILLKVLEGSRTQELLAHTRTVMIPLLVQQVIQTMWRLKKVSSINKIDHQCYSLIFKLSCMCYHLFGRQLSSSCMLDKAIINGSALGLVLFCWMREWPLLTCHNQPRFVVHFSLFLICFNTHSYIFMAHICKDKRVF